MSLGLPEPRTDISEITISCLNVDLVERSMKKDCFDLSIGFPKSFDCCMKVFANRICTSVPKANLLDERIAESIIGEREASIEAGD